MLVRATRTVSALTLRAAFYAALFLVVALVHVAITSGLRAAGLGGGVSLLISGAVVLAVVLVLVNVADYVGERRAGAREIRRLKQNLPGGPCCVIWRAASEGEADMPWTPIGAIRARYPALARRLGVEGVAVIDFEINAQGAPKNMHCVYAWPSHVFYEAAEEAMAHARFAPREGVDLRFGASYRMPFVFRIAGAARLKDAGQRAGRFRPALAAASQAVEKLRRSA